MKKLSLMQKDDGPFHTENFEKMDSRSKLVRKFCVCLGTGKAKGPATWPLIFLLHHCWCLEKGPLEGLVFVKGLVCS